MKRVLSITLLSLLLLTSCEKGKKEYRRIDDLAWLGNKTSAIINDPSTLTLEDEDLEFYIGIDDDDYEEGLLILSTSGVSIDEVGIFIAEKGKEDTLEKKLQDYITTCREVKKEWLESYNPGEVEKLNTAKVFRFGNCIGYLFLSNDKSEELLSTVENYLKNN